jgi:hypothetical protein
MATTPLINHRMAYNPEKIRKQHTSRWFKKSFELCEKDFDSRGDGGHAIFAVMGTLALNSWRQVKI